MVEKLEQKDHMSLYGEDDNEEYLLASMGVAYRLDDDSIWFVKVPIEDGEANVDEAIMVQVEGHDPKKHTERDDEPVVYEAAEDAANWYDSL